jgi:hypothetical protein
MTSMKNKITDSPCPLFIPSLDHGSFVVSAGRSGHRFRGHDGGACTVDADP